jgi:16S rRNA A1518/A1519 N6-dimethyltransferase RsmA/KsgA/DIM1 with predicted DNA glycosylase/AP lyase activity
MDWPTITSEPLQNWAYSSDQRLSKDVDHKVLLHPKHLSSLIELAAQNDCPKQKNIESIIEYFMQCCFLNNRREYLQQIQNIISDNKAQLNTSWLILWSINFTYIYKVYCQDTIMTEAACEKIAKDLMVGQYTQRSFKKLARLEDGSYAFLATQASLKFFFLCAAPDGQMETFEASTFVEF